MIRKTLEKPVKILRRIHINGVSADKAFRLAKREGLTIISNKRADQLLTDPDWESRLHLWPIWTGTMTAYTEPGKKFSATIDYVDKNTGLTWIFEVPEGIGLRGLKNVLLAIEHPNYNLEVDAKKRRVIITPQKKFIFPVENFPFEYGWYAIDPTTAIPINKPLDPTNIGARGLSRKPQRVGPVVRGNGGGYERYISLNDFPDDRFGVLIEAKELDLETAKRLLKTTQRKLKLIEDIVRDENPKLERFAGTNNPEFLEELSELIKHYTNQ